MIDIIYYIIYYISKKNSKRLDHFFGFVGSESGTGIQRDLSGN